MTIYLITYDLRVPGQNYSDLINEIKAIANGWAKPCESTWIVKSSLTSEAIVNRLTAIDATDRVVVITVSTPWYSTGLDKNVLQWLLDNVK